MKSRSGDKNKDQKFEYLNSFVPLKSKNPCIYMNIEVCYEEKEDIGKFADYLMDLDEDVYSFYFRFEYRHEPKKLLKVIKSKYGFIEVDMNDLEKIKDVESEEYKDKLVNIKRKLLKYYLDSFEPVYFFTDVSYDLKKKMERKELLELFHFSCINANNRLTDEEVDRKYSISKEMISYVSREPDWENMMEELPGKIKGIIDDQEIKKIINRKSLEGLKSAIKEIKRTNGGKEAEMFLDLEVEEEAIKVLIDNITKIPFFYFWLGLLLSTCSKSFFVFIGVIHLPNDVFSVFLSICVSFTIGLGQEITCTSIVKDFLLYEQLLLDGS